MPISYGATNAQSDDPYAIENSMAQGMLNPKTDPMALLLLNSYSAQRKTASDNADMALQSQHQFARQQLAAQLQKDAAEAATNAAKAPGGLALFAGQRDGYGSQYSQELLRNLIARQGSMEDAERVGKVATAAKAGVESGYEIPTADASGMAGVNFNRITPLSEKVAGINANARAVAAHIGAAPRIQIEVPGPQGKPIIGSIKVGPNMEQDIDNLYKSLNVARDYTAPRVNMQGNGTPNSSGAPVAPPRGSSTEAQTNQSEIPASARSKVGAALDWYRANKPDAYRSLVSTGANTTLHMGSDGKVYMLDANRTPHPLDVGTNR